MANPEHLEIIKQGADAWNQWRVQNLSTSPDLSGANLTGISLPDINLKGVELHDSLMDHAYLGRANLTDANLSKIMLVGAKLIGSNLTGANLSEAHLDAADFFDSVLDNALLIGASLNNAELRGTSLHGANLSRTEIIGADFRDADMANVDFSYAEISWTTFSNNDLSSVKGLETVQCSGPSSISIDTVFRSNGKIPELFLKRAGIPDDFITYMRSIVNQAIQFYSCFISFTEGDDFFSERLYNDLQIAGVRCWRWKEDAKWGKTLLRSIDDAVRVYDKLVVICSENSLNSPAVIREIERALQKEDDLARQEKDSEVLFPIRLDDYIFTGWNHHRKADVIAKNIGDFRHWKEPELYRRSLERLIRDLKA
jgi:hypothetical protein